VTYTAVFYALLMHTFHIQFCNNRSHYERVYTISSDKHEQRFFEYRKFLQVLP